MAYIPDGVKDTLSSECERKQKLIDVLKGLFKSYGYRQIETPTFEYYDTLNEIKNTVDKDSTLKIIDKDGKILVLRPDITMPIVRMAADNYNKMDSYLKLCYAMQVFRTNKKYRKREMTQVGIEYLGRQTPYADGEVITLAIESLLACGATEFQIDIGQTDYIKALLEGIERRKEIQMYISNKNFIGLSEAVDKLDISEKRKEAIKKIPYLYGNIKEVLEGAYLENEQACAAIDRLKETYEMLEAQGYKDYVSFDLGMVQDLNYYTGIIFKGYMNNFGKPVLSGGRYDDLMKQYKQDTSATGFGIDVDGLLEALENNDVHIEDEQYTDYLVIGEDIKAVLDKSKGLRAQGYSVEYIIGTDSGKTQQIRNIRNLIEV